MNQKQQDAVDRLRKARGQLALAEQIGNAFAADVARQAIAAAEAAYWAAAQ